MHSYNSNFILNESNLDIAKSILVNNIPSIVNKVILNLYQKLKIDEVLNFKLQSLSKKQLESLEFQFQQKLCKVNKIFNSCNEVLSTINNLIETEKQYLQRYILTIVCTEKNKILNALTKVNSKSNYFFLL